MRLNMEEVSVIMPVYNAISTIENSVKSVIEQETEIKYRLILVNDGSTDGTEEICAKYSKKFPNLIRYINSENKGVSHARNLGLKEAKGKYIMFIDSDDYYVKDTIDEMVKTIKRNNCEMVICGCKRSNYVTNNSILKYLPNMLYKRSEYNKIIEKGQNNNLFNAVNNKIFLNSIIKYNKLTFDNNLNLGEDYRFVLEYLKYTKCIYNTEKILYLYTNSNEGLNFKYRNDRIDINFKNIELLENFYNNENFKLDYINEKYFKSTISGICNAYKSGKNKNKELEELCNKEFILIKLNKSKKIVSKIIVLIIKYKKIYLLKIIGKIAQKYEKRYKNKRLGF